MEKEKALIGAGGFAREIKAHMKMPNMKCYVDDEFHDGSNETVFPLSMFNPNTQIALVVVGDPSERNNIVKKLPSETKYFTFIHPSAIILDNNINIGDGSIVCANTILTTNISIGKHSHINLSSTIGHDVVIGDFITLAPGTKISGNCVIGDRVYFGSNSSVRQKINICNDVTIGLNTGVVKDITSSGTYIGTPSKKIK